MIKERITEYTCSPDGTRIIGRSYVVLKNEDLVSGEIEQKKEKPEILTTINPNSRKYSDVKALLAEQTANDYRRKADEAAAEIDSLKVEIEQIDSRIERLGKRAERLEGAVKIVDRIIKAVGFLFGLLVTSWIFIGSEREITESLVGLLLAYLTATCFGVFGSVVVYFTTKPLIAKAVQPIIDRQQKKIVAKLSSTEKRKDRTLSKVKEATFTRDYNRRLEELERGNAQHYRGF